jgi:hypothetical protein
MTKQRMEEEKIWGKSEKHTATDVGKTSHPVHALCLQAAVPQHLHHLSVFLPVLLERELALLVVGLVLSSASILAAL